MKSSLWKMKGTLLILSVWIITFVFSPFFDFPPLFCGKGLDRIGGEYYRIFTGAMLHTNAVHLAANCLVLFWIGRYLEIHIGSGAYLGFGILSCVLAEGIFLAIYKKTEASCGGSVFPIFFYGMDPGPAIQSGVPAVPAGNMVRQLDWDLRGSRQYSAVFFYRCGHTCAPRHCSGNRRYTGRRFCPLRLGSRKTKGLAFLFYRKAELPKARPTA